MAGIMVETDWREGSGRPWMIQWSGDPTGLTTSEMGARIVISRAGE